MLEYRPGFGDGCVLRDGEEHNAGSCFSFGLVGIRAVALSVSGEKKGVVMGARGLSMGLKTLHLSVAVSLSVDIEAGLWRLLRKNPRRRRIKRRPTTPPRTAETNPE